MQMCIKPIHFSVSYQQAIYTYLGVHLDQTLNFKYHLESVINNITFKLYLFSKIRRFMNEKSAVIVYKTMLMPFFDYCDIVYMFSCPNELQKLNRHHLRGMKLSLIGGNHMDEHELYIKCNLSNLDARRNVHLRNYMFKIKKFNEYMVDNRDLNISTRLHDGPVFKVIHPNSEPIKRSVMYAGANEWNNLDADIRNIEDPVKFKRIKKSWLLNTFLD